MQLYFFKNKKDLHSAKYGIKMMMIQVQVYCHDMRNRKYPELWNWAYGKYTCIQHSIWLAHMQIISLILLCIKSITLLNLIKTSYKMPHTYTHGTAIVDCEVLQVVWKYHLQSVLHGFSFEMSNGIYPDEKYASIKFLQILYCQPPPNMTVTFLSPSCTTNFVLGG